MSGYCCIGQVINVGYYDDDRTWFYMVGNMGCTNIAMTTERYNEVKQFYCRYTPLDGGMYQEIPVTRKFVDAYAKRFYKIATTKWGFNSDAYWRAR